MHEPHTPAAFDDDADRLEVDQAWLEEIEPEPITLRTRRPFPARLTFGAIIAGAALAGAIARPALLSRVHRAPWRRPAGLFVASVSAGLAILAVAGFVALARNADAATGLLTS